MWKFIFAVKVAHLQYNRNMNQVSAVSYREVAGVKSSERISL